MRASSRRSAALLSLLTTGFLVAGAALALAGDASEEDPIVGRFAVESEAGGAIWAFQPGGVLVLSGPGDLMATGAWTIADEERAFDAHIELEVNGQQLEIMGAVSPDRLRVAMLVVASAATDPTAAVPWPAESRLVGERLGMVAEATPAASPPVDCARPAWSDDGAVDWDRCDAAASASPPASPSPSTAASPAASPAAASSALPGSSPSPASGASPPA